MKKLIALSGRSKPVPVGHPLVWLLAARPKTLAAAAVPVAVGTALAVRLETWQAFPALLCLSFALLVQVGTNFANDYFDFLKGADTPGRLGPARMVASGLISLAAMRRAIGVAFVLAFLAGIPLVFYGGWWLVVIGVASIVFGLAYTAGPWALAYNGLGELFVFLFFGWVAVAFTFYVQAGVFAWETLLLGAGVGALATNILAVNNARDFQTDALADKKTLVVRFGRDFAWKEYATSLAVAGAVPILLWWLGFGAAVLLAALPVLFGVRLFFRFKTAIATGFGSGSETLLGKTAALLFAYGLLLSIGLLLS